MPDGTILTLVIALIVLLVLLRRAHEYSRRKSDSLARLDGELAALRNQNALLQKQVSEHRALLLANSAFLANIGQELRSPLSGVLGMNELLMDTQLTQEQRELAKAIYDSAYSLLDVAADLQELARVEAGVIADDVPLDLTEVVREACALSAEGIRRKKLFINVDTDPDIPRALIGDRNGLRQALSQLLRNALATTHRGGIVLRTSKVGQSPDAVEVRFSIKDTGMGFTPEEQESLFQPFGGEHTWDRSNAGTGLGLFLCKRTIDTMGGVLCVESKKNLGTEFFFTLKLQVDSRAVDEVASAPPHPNQDDPVTSGNHPYTPRRSMDR